MSKKISKKICSKCKEEKILVDFYLASNDAINSDGRLCICKICLEKTMDFTDVESLISAMRMVDRPFIRNDYEASLSARNPFGEYMRRMGMPQNKNRTYLDSEFDKTLAKHSNKKKKDEYLESVELSKRGISEDNLSTLRKKWGDFEEGDYMFLEEFYRDYERTYSTDTPAQVNLYRNIAKTHLQADKELSSGNIKAYKDLMELSSKMHTDGNIKPIQNTGGNEDRGVSTYGLWIKEIEKEEPCEFFENRELYDDYDSIKKYWKNWFVRPFKNIFNISKDFDVGDDK